MEKKENKSSNERVLRAFRRDCIRCRFHVTRLLRDSYYGHKYHGRFYVSCLNASTTFAMGQRALRRYYSRRTKP
ncbi:hypothetical protein GOP47_0012458 [Adiantum capillus-veneris]|uniref:Uncharacterized protein n=1 Tax=Adiantum capillus-veneris TaxID=13818 RepID=A0A9D4ZFQ3_ADICA|nr:hypothetical protein GOP47_0012458 [Adiantum capillus-veneris]